MASATPTIITDRKLVQEMQRDLWRDEARRARFSEPDVERLTFTRWRLSQFSQASDHAAGQRVIRGPARKARAGEGNE